MAAKTSGRQARKSGSRGGRGQAPAPAGADWWNPRWLIFGVILLGVALGGYGLYRLERLNRRIQAERRMQENPLAAEWLQRMKREVAEAQSPRGSGTGLAEAVWMGTIADRSHNRPDGARPVVVMVRMRPAWLLAGSRSPKDEADGQVTIAVRDFSFSSGEPQLGERWLFAVTRRNGGYNFVRSAIRVP